MRHQNGTHCQYTVMAQRKRKIVFTAEDRQLRAIQRVVRAGRYRSASELLREAIDDKLRSLSAELLAAQVETYVAGGSAAEDLDLIPAQAFDEDD
jgi:Arc/MetJ-type ribon-helix-helix transcriptional regulator